MSDLTRDEQTNVRTALRFLRTRTGSWGTVAKGIGMSAPPLRLMVSGHRNVSARLALLVARLAGVGVDALLRGEYPAPGTCPHCGHCPEGEATGERSVQ